MRFTNNRLFRIFLHQIAPIPAKTKYIHRTHNNSAQTNTSATRNSPPISEALREQLDLETPGLQLLEIASGCGQHAAYFAPLFPNITFQPTENENREFESICAYAADCPTKNIRQPIHVDITRDLSNSLRPELQPASFDYMFNSNMMHITPFECSVGLFRAAGLLLKPQGLLFTYGPYAVDGVLKPESNVNFDLSLKSRNSAWGVRDIADLKQLGAGNGIELKRIVEMPSNNKLLTWIKK